MRALDRLLSTEAEDLAPEQRGAVQSRVNAKSREAEVEQDMQRPVGLPSRKALMAMLSESERAILRKQGK